MLVAGGSFEPQPAIEMARLSAIAAGSDRRHVARNFIWVSDRRHVARNFIWVHSDRDDRGPDSRKPFRPNRTPRCRSGRLGHSHTPAAKSSMSTGPCIVRVCPGPALRREWKNAGDLNIGTALVQAISGDAPHRCLFCPFPTESDATRAALRHSGALAYNLHPLRSPQSSNGAVAASGPGLEGFAALKECP